MEMPSSSTTSVSGSLGFEIELRKIVQHVNGDAVELDHFRLRQLARPRPLVDVAANGGHGSNGCKLVENFRIAHIAAVNDLLRSAQRFERFRPQQSVRIGNDADKDRSSQFSVLSSQSSTSSRYSFPRGRARLPCWCMCLSFLFPPPACEACPSPPASAPSPG